MPKPAYNERIQWSPNWSARNRAGIDYGALHTQEGDGTAASLANYLCNPNSGVSYHYTVDNDRNVVAVVDTDDASWSVGNANHKVVNICFAGSRASWTRQQWLGRMGNAIEIAAYLQVMDARKYGFDPVVRGWDELKAGKTGLTDHRGINMGVLRAAGHTDVGDYFPWDIYDAHVRRFRDEGTEPIADVTAIEYCRAANEWLGAKKITDRELPLPDQIGRFAPYEGGSIYWHPGTKAWAIPNALLSKYASARWETGVLGYPVANKLDLKPFTHSDGRAVAGGLVQAFQFGAIYRQDGQDAFIVHGSIRGLYARLRYELGDLGWPVSDEQPWGDREYGGALQVFEGGVIYWIAQGGSCIAVDNNRRIILPKAPGYQPTPEEIQLTPKDGMTGGISHFANADDASTAGRNMGISGEPADRPTDQWFCAMRFNYVEVQPNPGNPSWVKPVPGTSNLELKAYLPGRRLMVTNPANNARVVVRPADWGPGVPTRVIDVSETAMDSLDAVTDTPVRVEWVDPSTPLGPKQ